MAWRRSRGKSILSERRIFFTEAKNRLPILVPCGMLETKGGFHMEMYMKSLREWLESQRETPIEGMTAFFDRVMEGYDEHMLAHWQDSYRALAEMIPGGAENLLDLGCGTGLELEEVWRRLPDACVTGVDLTRTMLDELERRAGKRRLRTICGDYFQVELGERLYDAVITFESLHHFSAERKLPLYRRIHRALKPNGLFLYGDYFACCEEEERLLAEECARKRAAARLPEDQFVHFDTPLTVETELALLRQAGFELMQDCRQDMSTHILVLAARSA